MSNFINRPTTTPLAATGTPMMAGTVPLMPGAVATTVLPATTGTSLMGGHQHGEKLSWHEKRAIKHQEKAIKHENKALRHGHGHGHQQHGLPLVVEQPRLASTNLLHQTTTDQRGLLPGHSHASPTTATGTMGHATVGQKIKGTVKEVQGAVTHNPMKKEEGRLLKQGIEPATMGMGNTATRRI